MGARPRRWWMHPIEEAPPAKIPNHPWPGLGDRPKRSTKLYPEVTGDPLVVARATESIRAVEREVERLDAERDRLLEVRRRAVVMLRDEGLSLRQIGRIASLSSTTVMNEIARHAAEHVTE